MRTSIWAQMRARFWIPIALSVLVGGALGAIVQLRQPSGYVADIRMFASSEKADYVAVSQSMTLAIQRMGSYVKLADSTRLAEQLAEGLDLSESPESVASRITASQVKDTTIMAVSVWAPSAAEARQIAEALPGAYTDLVNSLAESTGVDPVRTQFTIVDGPRVHLSSSLTKLGLSTLLGMALFGSLALALSAPFARRIADRSPEVMVHHTGLPVLSIVPDARADASSEQRGGPLVSRPLAYGRLATNLRMLSPGPHRTVIVTAPRPGPGATSVVRGLARALGNRDEKVLIVDATTHGSRPASRNAGGCHRSLQDALESAVSSGSALAPSSEVPGAASVCLAHGPLKPGQHHLLSEALDELSREFDTILVDAPPVLIAEDRPLPVDVADAALLVVDQKKGAVETAGAAAATLRALGVTRAAIVINRASVQSLPPDQVLSGLVLPAVSSSAAQ